ncbi:MAG: hypothetical protein M3Q65_21740 [Chloroflexota bacterium]|nr:hypothetical protein [Chloroflexota bacterium]
MSVTDLTAPPHPSVFAPAEPAVASGAAAARANTHSTYWHHAFTAIALFLIVFGLFNFAELPLGWKDRGPQISRYLAATVGLGPAWVPAALWLTKSVEGLLGLAALVGLLRRDSRWLVATLVGWQGVMIGFSVMDVWAADRAELQEHTLYFAGFAQLLMVLIVLETATRVARWLRPRAE